MRYLIDPLWILLAILGVPIFVSQKLARFEKSIKRCNLFSLVVLMFLSTGVATSIFDSILNTDTEPKSSWSPEFIFVLGGGYELGASELQDFLGTESIRRVNAASEVWIKYPLAKVVFSGQQPSTQDDRASTRHGELSRAHAILIGLEKSRIIIESASENTRQHPIEALKVRGVTKNSPIAIVTSDFHLRRASGAFKKYFNNLESFGTNDATSSISWLDFVPLASHLNDNTYRIKEFVGLLMRRVMA